MLFIHLVNKSDLLIFTANSKKQSVLGQKEETKIYTTGDASRFIKFLYTILVEALAREIFHSYFDFEGRSNYREG